jgi:hypothetical protein
VALPSCDRQDDQSTIDEGGCLLQTALSLGYDGIAANSFHLAYRVCYDGDFTELVQQYGGGSDDPGVIARTLANRTFDNDESESAGFDACMLALADRGHT